MFVEPTLNDFLENIRWHLTKAATNASRAVKGVQNDVIGRAFFGSTP
jgi:hypothetical protein